MPLLVRACGEGDCGGTNNATQMLQPLWREEETMEGGGRQVQELMGLPTRVTNPTRCHRNTPCTYVCPRGGGECLDVPLDLPFQASRCGGKASLAACRNRAATKSRKATGCAAQRPATNRSRATAKQHSAESHAATTSWAARPKSSAPAKAASRPKPNPCLGSAVAGIRVTDTTSLAKAAPPSAAAQVRPGLNGRGKSSNGAPNPPRTNGKCCLLGGPSRSNWTVPPCSFNPGLSPAPKASTPLHGGKRRLRTATACSRAAQQPNWLHIIALVVP